MGLLSCNKSLLGPACSAPFASLRDLQVVSSAISPQWACFPTAVTFQLLGLAVSASTVEDHQPPPNSNYGTISDSGPYSPTARLLTFWLRRDVWQGDLGPLSFGWGPSSLPWPSPEDWIFYGTMWRASISMVPASPWRSIGQHMVARMPDQCSYIALKALVAEWYTWFWRSRGDWGP